MSDSTKNKVPKVDWSSFYLKIAEYCAEKYKFRQNFDGWKYKVISFWEVIVFAVLFNISTKAASDRLNKLKFAQVNKKCRRKKIPKQLGGRRVRHERLVPDKSQVDDFKRRLPKWLVKNLQHYVLKAQVEYLLGCKMLHKTIDVIIDFNDKPYYGKLKTGDSNTIHGTTKAPGTRRVRKFLGVLIKSKMLRVFTHFDLVHKGIHHDEFVKAALGELLSWGFKIHRVLADRWFANRGVLEWCKDHHIKYVGPIQKRKNIIALIHKYLKTGGTALFEFAMQGDPSRYGTKNPLHVWIFFIARGGERIGDVRQQYKKKQLTLDEATAKIHVFVVTSRPPSGKQARAAWMRGLARVYKKRWYIETAFRDLGRFQPTCHARTDAAKILDATMRCWLYNAWQIERECRRRLRDVPASWRAGPTWNEFCDIIYETEYEAGCFATA